MKPRTHHPKRGGFSLLELIAYMGVFALLLGMALLAFYKCCDNYFAVRRHSDDITRAVRAGEVWRQDVRAATAAVHFSAADQSLRIPRRDGEVAYRFTDETVYRQAAMNAPWSVFLPRVAGSTMTEDSRTQVKAWRWEVELKAKQVAPKIRPVFTFLAAAPAAPGP